MVFHPSTCWTITFPPFDVTTCFTGWTIASQKLDNLESRKAAAGINTTDSIDHIPGCVCSNFPNLQWQDKPTYPLSPSRNNSCFPGFGFTLWGCRGCGGFEPQTATLLLNPEYALWKWAHYWCQDWLLKAYPERCKDGQVFLPFLKLPQRIFVSTTQLKAIARDTKCLKT